MFGGNGTGSGEQVLTISLSVPPGADKPEAVIGITDVAWSMPTRANLKAFVGVNSQTMVSTRAHTFDQVVIIDIALTDLPVLQGAHVLHVSLPTFVDSYNLAGSRRAIDALADAFQAFVGSGARVSDPFAGARQHRRAHPSVTRSRPCAAGTPNHDRGRRTAWTSR